MASPNAQDELVQALLRSEFDAVRNALSDGANAGKTPLILPLGWRREEGAAVLKQFGALES